MSVSLHKQANFDRVQFAQRLHDGAQSMQFNLSVEQENALLDYLALFAKWNRTYNLSAIRQFDEMLNKHLLDSLSIAFHVQASNHQRFIDVGTGGGLPGIPMAICFPERHFTLLDSAGKKTRFLFQVKQALSLTNVEIKNCRVEDYEPSEKFDVVVSRAFASLEDMTESCAHLLTQNGKFWAMKGLIPKQELSEVEKRYKVEHCFELQVPGNIGERCLIVLKIQE